MKLKSKYSLVLWQEASNKYSFDVLPIKYDTISRSNTWEFKTGVFDLSGSIPKLYTEDKDGNKDPLSEIIFWLNIDSKWYGQYLYNGIRVLAKLDGDLERCNDSDIERIVALDIIIDERLFDQNIKVDSKSEDDYYWAKAKRNKIFKTESLSVYHYHGFYGK